MSRSSGMSHRGLIGPGYFRHQNDFSFLGFLPIRRKYGFFLLTGHIPMVAKVMALQHIRETAMDKLRDDLADVREVVLRDFADFFQGFPPGAQAEDSQFGFDFLVAILFPRGFNFRLLF